MRIRVFTVERDPLEKLLNLLKHQSGGRMAVLFCSPEQWLPPAEADGSTVADLHIYVGAPVRLAVPWARYNLLVGSADTCVPGDMDRVEPADNLVGPSKQILATVREWLSKAQRGAHDAALPVAPAKGAMPPKIAILTATGGRRAWWPNMVQNVTGQAWPVSRLEWCIVDDEGDDCLADLVAELREKTPSLVIHYKSVRPGTSIGAKRNLAAEMAGADVSVFAVMDDDDHYPANSLSARVSWLSRSRPTDVVYCGTLPMYDLRRYISAINVSPLTETPTFRASEASMLFTRAFWEERGWPKSSMGEGAGFLKDRLDRSVEIGPADVIVSFIHTANSSSRRVPTEQPPNGCHYGFSDDYFRYLHGLVGDALLTSSESKTGDSGAPAQSSTATGPATA
jgi:hypothetical protein